jgi:hypothetical protein
MVKLVKFQSISEPDMSLQNSASLPITMETQDFHRGTQCQQTDAVFNGQRAQHAYETSQK